MTAHCLRGRRSARPLFTRRTVSVVVSTALLLTSVSVLGDSEVSGAATPASATEPALAPVADHSVWGTNGRVVDIVSKGSTAWIVGGFDYVGPTTGRGVLVNGTNGARLSNDANVLDDAVYASAPDGAGGYYLGGVFSRVGTFSRKGLVHILASGGVDTAFAPKVTGTVQALAYTGNKLLVGGSLTNVNGSSAANLIALNPDGSLVSGWNPAPNGPVNALAVAGSAVYVGGSFSSIGGRGGLNIARLDVASGTVATSFPVTANGAVQALAVTPGATSSGDTLFLGGDFASVTGAGSSGGRTRLAAVSGTGSLLPWSPTADAQVRAVAIDPATGSVWVGGAFSTVNGQPRSRLARLGTDGSLSSFDAALSGCQQPHTLQFTNQYPPCTTEVNTLSVSGGVVYVGGLFTTASGAMRHNGAAYATASSTLTGWAPMPGARVRSLVPNGSSVILGGDFTSVNGQYHRGIARINLTTGQAESGFVANADDMPLDIELTADGSRLFVGGTFKSVNGAAQQRVASLDPASGAIDPAFRPTIDKDVYTIAVRQSFIYVGGLFTTINRQTRSHAARLSIVDGSVDQSWTANTSGPSGMQKNGMVVSLAVMADNSRVFLAGPFDNVNGAGVAGGIIALDGASGAVLPSRLGAVQRCGSLYWITKLYLSDDGQRLYGGDYCPDWIYQWDAVNLADQKPNGVNWMTWCNGGMQGTLEVNGHFYYGTHGNACAPTVGTPAASRVSRVRQAVYDQDTGSILNYAPFYDSPMGVWSYAVAPQGLLVGGDFTLAGDRNTVQQGLALFRGTP